MQPADPPILDQAVLAELLASTGDDPEFVRELLETYLAETPEQLDAISAAIAADDAATLVRPAHTLKSSSATMGAMRLSALARELEMAGRSGALEAGLRRLAEDAATAWLGTADALHAWLSEHAA